MSNNRNDDKPKKNTNNPYPETPKYMFQNPPRGPAGDALREKQAKWRAEQAEGLRLQNEKFKQEREQERAIRKQQREAEEAAKKEEAQKKQADADKSMNERLERQRAIAEAIKKMDDDQKRIDEINKQQKDEAKKSGMGASDSRSRSSSGAYEDLKGKLANVRNDSIEFRDKARSQNQEKEKTKNEKKSYISLGLGRKGSG